MYIYIYIYIKIHFHYILHSNNVKQLYYNNMFKIISTTKYKKKHKMIKLKRIYKTIK